MPTAYPQPTVALIRLYERISEYVMHTYPIKDLPLEVRPAIVFAVAAWVILLGILGMAPLDDLPVNDKALHFFGMGFATFMVYFIIEVPETPMRRVWYIRRSPLLLTLLIAFFFGGIVSEFAQALLPWKEFQWSDIFSNLLGSTLFLYLAHFLYQRSRKRAEISSLYQPLSSATYRDSQGRQHHFSGLDSPPDVSSSNNNNDRVRQPFGPYGKTRQQQRQGSNVWDEDSDVEAGRPSAEESFRTAQNGFEIGDDDDHR